MEAKGLQPGDCRGPLVSLCNLRASVLRGRLFTAGVVLVCPPSGSVDPLRFSSRGSSVKFFCRPPIAQRTLPRQRFKIRPSELCSGLQIAHAGQELVPPAHARRILRYRTSLKRYYVHINHVVLPNCMKPSASLRNRLG